MGETPSFSIGIDLGTTYSCVAVLRSQSQKPEVIQNDMGNNTTPSYVSFNIDEDEDGDEDIYAGDAAKDEAYQNPENTVFDIKRLIGRTFYDAHVQKYKHLWPFHLTEIHGLVGVKIGDKELLPQTISVHLISYLKEIAENYLGCSIDSAVVTIPVYYNQLQQDLTRASCAKAGLKSVEFITEPVAAALAYGLESSIKNKGNNKTCLIFDLGGGTFDITIFTINEDNQVVIKATGGDDRLGGEDFNDLLTEYCLKEFKMQHGIDLTEGKQSKDDELRKKVAKRFRRIRSECERQKCFLTSTTKVVISLDGLIADTPMAVPVSRKLFEDLIAGHLTRCITTVGKVLKNAGMTKGDIDDVILIGGSSRIPKVQELLSDYFEGKRLHMSIDADEAVACGAAVHACNTFHGKSSASGIALILQKLNQETDYEPENVETKNLKTNQSTEESTRSSEKNRPPLQFNPKFDLVLEVLDSLSFLSYKNKFIENEIHDAMLEECILDGTINESLRHVIPFAPHRTQFVKTFSALAVDESTTRSIESQTTAVPVNNDSKAPNKGSTSTASDSTSEAPAVKHYGITCDGSPSCRYSKTSMNGPRYKCLQCMHFDLCEHCMKSKMHSHHFFVKIPNPDMYSERLEAILGLVAKSDSLDSTPLTNADSTRLYPPVCDSCDKEIVTSSYRCLQCLDFNLCQKCMNKKIHSNHFLVTIPGPEMYSQRLAGILRVISESGCLDSLPLKDRDSTRLYRPDCNGCGKKDVTPSYRCLQCLDFDLCQRCMNKKVHASHLFVTIPSQTVFSRQLVDIMRSVAKSKALNNIPFTRPDSTIPYYGRCDGCKIRIEAGSCFRCIECVDFDLCRECMKKKCHSHHLFVKIPRAAMYSYRLACLLRLSLALANK